MTYDSHGAGTGKETDGRRTPRALKDAGTRAPITSLPVRLGPRRMSVCTLLSLSSPHHSPPSRCLRVSSGNQGTTARRCWRQYNIEWLSTGQNLVLGCTLIRRCEVECVVAGFIRQLTTIPSGSRTIFQAPINGVSKQVRSGVHRTPRNEPFRCSRYRRVRFPSLWGWEITNVT